MTPTEFVVEIRKMHEPYLPELVGVIQNEFREPTIDDHVEAVQMWCDGCNTSAEKCRIQHLLVLLEM